MLNKVDKKDIYHFKRQKVKNILIHNGDKNGILLFWIYMNRQFERNTEFVYWFISFTNETMSIKRPKEYSLRRSSSKIYELTHS